MFDLQNLLILLQLWKVTRRCDIKFTSNIGNIGVGKSTLCAELEKQYPTDCSTFREQTNELFLKMFYRNPVGFFYNSISLTSSINSRNTVLHSNGGCSNQGYTNYVQRNQFLAFRQIRKINIYTFGIEACWETICLRFGKDFTLCRNLST